MTKKPPLLAIATEIHKQDRLAAHRRLWLQFIDRGWIYTLVAAGAMSVVFVLLWPIAAATFVGPVELVLENISHAVQQSITPGTPRPNIDLESSWTVSLTVPLIFIGTLVAVRQSYLNTISQIASDKRTARTQTIDHLRSTIDEYRKDEQEFLADLYDMYEYKRPPSRVTVFVQAVENKVDRTVQCNPNIDREQARLEVINRLCPDSRTSRGTINPLHARPRLTPAVAELATTYYPLFSYAWGHLMKHEALGLGLARKSFGIRTIDGISGPQLVDNFLTWQAFVDRVQSIPGYRTAFSQFQWLAACIVMLRAARSAGRYYGIPIVDGISKPDDHNLHWLILARSKQFFPKRNTAYYRPRLRNALSPIMRYIANDPNSKPSLYAELDNMISTIISKRNNTPVSDCILKTDANTSEVYTPANYIESKSTGHVPLRNNTTRSGR